MKKIQTLLSLLLLLLGCSTTPKTVDLYPESKEDFFLFYNRCKAKSVLINTSAEKLDVSRGYLDIRFDADFKTNLQEALATYQEGSAILFIYSDEPNLRAKIQTELPKILRSTKAPITFTHIWLNEL